MTFNPNISNREVADLVLCNYKDKTPWLNLDFANVTTTGLTSERVFAKGGAGAPNRVGFDGNMAGTLKVDTQITPMKLYAMLAGNEIESSAQVIQRKVLSAAEGAITLPAGESPIAGSVHVFAEGDDCGTEIPCTVTGSKIELTGATNGEYVIYYLVSKSGEGVQSVKFTAVDFPRAFTIYGETPWKSEDDEIVAMHLTYCKAQPQSTFELAFSNNGDPTMLSITFDLLADENNDIYKMAVVA